MRMTTPRGAWLFPFAYLACAAPGASSESVAPLPSPRSSEAPAPVADAPSTGASPGKLAGLHLRVFHPVGPTAPDDLHQAERVRYALFLEEDHLRTCLPSRTAPGGAWWRFVLHVAFDGRGHLRPGTGELGLEGAPPPVGQCMMRVITAIDMTSNPPPVMNMSVEMSFEP